MIVKKYQLTLSVVNLNKLFLELLDAKICSFTISATLGVIQIAPNCDCNIDNGVSPL